MFKIRDLAVLSYAHGFTFWIYKYGSDPIAIMKSEGFFDAAADMFAIGDVILCTGTRGATQVCVTSTDKGHVTVQPMVVL